GRDLTVFNCAASTLLRLLPGLPGEVRAWLDVLANPLRSAENNLRAALESPALPRPVWEAFAALGARRLAWWARQRNRPEGPAPAPPAYPDQKRLWELVQEVLCQPSVNRGDKEAAWLLARLCELLQHEAQ